jgi:hypothetical protein
MSDSFVSRCLLRLAPVVFTASVVSTSCRADEVMDWTRISLQATHLSTTSSLTASRNLAIVETAMYDAVNGIDARYQVYFVQPAAAQGASDRTAAVQAAYVSLVHLLPAQTATFNAARTASLAAIALDVCNPMNQAACKQAMDDGVAWGQQVGDAIWKLRSTDGFTPAPAPFLGGTAVGEWRPTPPTFSPGAGPQFAYMTPWVLSAPGQFRPGPPPSLNSLHMTVDYYETLLMGKDTSPFRTADQTVAAQFWASTTPIYSWNSVAISLSTNAHLSLVENARLFALVNTAIADASISLWEAKYHYVTWRPVTAIALANTDGNPLTLPDPNWNPLIVTPAHPEYPSAHSGQSRAAVTVLAAFFGDNIPFSVDSDGLAGVVRHFSNFADAMRDIDDARIFGGIHYRNSCNVGQKEGDDVARYVLQHAFQDPQAVR